MDGQYCGDDVDAAIKREVCVSTGLRNTTGTFLNPVLSISMLDVLEKNFLSKEYKYVRYVYYFSIVATGGNKLCSLLIEVAQMYE